MRNEGVSCRSSAASQATRRHFDKQTVDREPWQDLIALALGLLGIARACAVRIIRTVSIRVVVPFPAGGTTDMLARLLTQKMGESMGQSFVVENVGGAGGSIGADQIAKAAPDGYSLLFHNLTFSTTTSSLQYAGRSRHDIEKDFVPISVGAYVPMLLMVHPSVPAKDLKEFVAVAKAAKDPMFYGSTGRAA